MMALIIDQKHIVAQLGVPPPETIHEHLGNHDDNPGPLDLIHELLAIPDVRLNEPPLRHAHLLVLLPVKAHHILPDVLLGEVDLVVVVVALVFDEPDYGLVAGDRRKVSLYGLGLLLHELHRVGQEDHLLLPAVLVEVVVHRQDAHQGLACPRGQIDYAVVPQAVLEQLLLLWAHTQLAQAAALGVRLLDDLDVRPDCYLGTIR